MAIAACRTCGHQVATSARSCPQCGDRRPHKTGIIATGERHELVTLLFALLAAGIAISLIAAVWR